MSYTLPEEKHFLSAVFPYLQRHCGIPVVFEGTGMREALSPLVADPQRISDLLERNENADTPPLPNVVRAAINCLSTPGADRIEYQAEDHSWRRLRSSGKYEVFDPAQPSYSKLLHRFPFSIDLMKRDPQSGDNVYIVCNEKFQKFVGPYASAVRFFRRELNTSTESSLVLIRVGSVDFIMDEEDAEKTKAAPEQPAAESKRNENGD